MFGFKLDIKRFSIYKYMILVLTILTLLGMFKAGYENTLQQVLLSVFTASVVDILIKKWKTGNWKVSETAIISGLFIGTILGEGVSWHIAVIASVLAILSKHIIKYKNKNIFNPASFGLVLVSFILSASHGWWASSNIYAVLLLGLFIAYWFERFHLVIGFWVPFVALSIFLNIFITGQPVNLINMLMNNTVLFFSFFMLTEPKTSPIVPTGRIMFGLLVAIFSLIFNFFNPANSFLLGLLAANLFVPIINKSEFIKSH